MSSKRHVRRKACEAKLRHPNRAAASTALRKLSHSPAFKGGRLGIYRCPFCRGWHVGHALNQRPTQHKGRRL